jgi:hypothetical protein
VTTRKRSHLGKAGHHAVMAEFLLRGWNVAIPEVDVGEDLFVVDDNADRVTRVQVKTTEQVARSSGKTLAKYGGISRNQLWSSSELPFYYVFVLREGRLWEFIVLQRAELQLLRAEAEGADASRPSTRPGPRPKPTRPRSEGEAGTITIALTFMETDVTAWGQSFQRYRNNWREFPEVSVGPGATARARGRSPAP